MSKGSKQRPGTGYADNWEATFGKKAKSEQALQELTDLSQELGLYDLPDAQQPSPKLMTLSEAMKAGYSTEYVNCGPSVSGAVIRVAKWDDALNCLQYIDVRPDEAQGECSIEVDKPARITGNFRCKVNGMDTGANLAWFEFLTQPGFNYVLEAIEPPAKTCQHCRYWSEANQPVGFGCCLNGAIGAFHERGESRIWLVPPADFGCLRWEGKV